MNRAKYHKNWNYCWSHGNDIPTRHHSDTCENQAPGHIWHAIGDDPYNGYKKASHKTQIWREGAECRNTNIHKAILKQACFVILTPTKHKHTTNYYNILYVSTIYKYCLQHALVKKQNSKPRTYTSTLPDGTALQLPKNVHWTCLSSHQWLDMGTSCLEWRIIPWFQSQNSVMLDERSFLITLIVSSYTKRGYPNRT